ncbi:MAG TPA: alpha/beta hydrolase [Solirubrobacterales bacterium]|nr:alpha/beta hydrolase [Solirubrobacterales bacterium]
MQGLLTALSRLSLRLFFKPVLGSRLPIRFQRRWVEAMTRILGGAGGIERSELWAGELSIRRLRRAGAGVGPVDPSTRDAILYVHGGGFEIGGGETYVGFASWIAAVTGADVYMPDYRLAPEHPQPAPTDDAFAAYRAMLELGHDPRRTAVVGDSAGGGIAVSTVRSLREMGLPSPAAMVLISPWLDLSLSGASVGLVGDRDPMLSRRWLVGSARSHAGGLHLDDPRISPLFAELRTLPPTLVQAGTDDILLDDSTRFADRAYAAGVEVELQRFAGQFHDFQVFAGLLATSRGALDDVAAFLRRHLAPAD